MKIKQLINKAGEATVLRTLLLFFVLLYSLLESFGIIHCPMDTLQEILQEGFTLLVVLLSWWKNNSFTDAAIKGDQLMHTIKESLNESIE